MSANTEEWEKKIGLADIYGTVAEVSFVPADGEGDAMTTMTMRNGAFTLHASPTPAALRQLAGALLDGAEAMETSS
jgi:hypothetical protein